jgi:hypothetical protein
MASAPPPEKGYQQTVAPEGFARLSPDATPDAFGAGIGRPLEQIGLQLARSDELNQTAKAGAAAANARAGFSMDLIKLQNDPTTDLATYPDQVNALLKQHTDVAMGSVSNTLAQRKLQAEMTEFAAQQNVNAAEYQTVQQRGDRYTDFDQQIDTSYNLLLHNPSKEAYLNEQLALDRTHATLGGPAALNAKAHHDAEWKLSEGYLRGNLAKSADTTLQMLDTGDWDSKLAPGVALQLREQALAQGAHEALKAQEVQTQAKAQNGAEITRQGTLITNGATPDDSDLAQLEQTAIGLGDKEGAQAAHILRLKRNVNVALQNGRPEDIRNAQAAAAAQVAADHAALKGLGDPKVSPLDQAMIKYPALKKLNPALVTNPGRQPGYSETWAPGEEGTPDNPRPAGLPIDRVGIEVYKPDQVGPDDIAAELLHVDPKAQQTTTALLATLSPAQLAYVKKESNDYQESLDSGESEQKAEENAATSAMRAYVFGQGGPAAFTGMKYTPAQRQMLDELKQYVTNPLIAQTTDHEIIYHHAMEVGQHYIDLYNSQPHVWSAAVTGHAPPPINWQTGAGFTDRATWRRGTEGTTGRPTTTLSPDEAAAVTQQIHTGTPTQVFTEAQAILRWGDEMPNVLKQIEPNGDSAFAQAVKLGRYSTTAMYDAIVGAEVKPGTTRAFTPDKNDPNAVRPVSAGGYVDKKAEPLSADQIFAQTTTQALRLRGPEYINGVHQNSRNMYARVATQEGWDKLHANSLVRQINRAAGGQPGANGEWTGGFGVVNGVSTQLPPLVTQRQFDQTRSRASIGDYIASAGGRIPYWNDRPATEGELQSMTPVSVGDGLYALQIRGTNGFLSAHWTEGKKPQVGRFAFSFDQLAKSQAANDAARASLVHRIMTTPPKGAGR